MSDSHSPSIQFTAINPDSQQMARKRARPDSPPPAQDSDEECEVSSREPSSADLAAERKREKKRQQRKARRARKQASSSASSSYDGEPPIVDLTGEEEGEQSDDSIQRKYFQPYQFPSMSREEDRVMFDMEERELRIYPAPRPAAPPVVDRVCTVCCSPGHSDATCPELLCQHCGEHNKHFSRACPHPRASSPSSTSSRSTPPPPPAEYDWRSETPRSTPAQRGILKAYCYNCAGSGHYGYDCPDISRSRRGIPGIFSGVIALEYVSETDTRSLPEYSRDTKTLKVCKNTGFGRSARMEEIASGLFDPFRKYRLSADGRSYQAYTSEYRNSMYGRSGSRMERGGGGGRNSSSRQYVPERQGGRDSNRDTYRPMPSAAQANWRQFRR
ncbi:hypothetical protein K440DRAFT_663435 [Wilcoxina mikolae CBS 423.85]|nr:hypothetical protein K440DRAFT_663435 [Wilcoxina mikolae CBS 423.85]